MTHRSLSFVIFSTTQENVFLRKRFRDTLTRTDNIVPLASSILCLKESRRTDSRQGQHKDDRILKGRPNNKRYCKLYCEPPLVRSVIPLPLNGSRIEQHGSAHETRLQGAKHERHAQRNPLFSSQVSAKVEFRSASIARRDGRKDRRRKTRNGLFDVDWIAPVVSDDRQNLHRPPRC